MWNIRSIVLQPPDHFQERIELLLLYQKKVMMVLPETLWAIQSSNLRGSLVHHKMAEILLFQGDYVALQLSSFN